MKCREVRESLLDMIEGTIGAGQGTAVQEHLARCEECRAELRMLQRGRDGLQASLERIAPVGEHLTRQRLDRLLWACAGRASKPRIISLRGFAAAAAAAAILVSGVSIYGHIRLMLERGRRAPVEYPQRMVALPPGWADMVALNSAPGDRSATVAFVLMRTTPALGAPSSEARSPDLLLTTSPGVNVPVRNAFYDCEEAGCWW